MKKKFILNLILAVIMIMGMSFTNAANSKYFKNITENIKNTHVVKCGSTVDSVSPSASLVSSNSNIAKVEGNSLKIVGTGHFNVTVKDAGTEKTYKFFAWNAYLKAGKYYTYNDAGKTQKSNVLYARTYLDLAKTENDSVFLVEEHLLATGVYSGSLNGKYLTSYYDIATNKSTTTYYEYAFSSNLSEQPNPPKEEPKPVEPSETDQAVDVPKMELDETVHKYSLSGKVVKSYSDSTIYVSLEKISKYYVTKIWVKNPAEQVKKKEAGWRKELKTVNEMLNSTSNAIVGCNGSGFYDKASFSPVESAIKRTSWDKTSEGYLVISNGVTRRAISGQQTNCLLGILPNGSFKYYENSSFSEVYNDAVRDSFTYGPMLISNGVIYEQKVGRVRQNYNSSADKRTAIGQVDENNFVIITTESTAKLNDVANMGLKLDCVSLYNLAGGPSTSLWFRGAQSGKGTQVKASSRGVSDALYFISTEQK